MTELQAFFPWGGGVEKYMVTCNYSLAKFDFMAKNIVHFCNFYEEQNSSLI